MAGEVLRMALATLDKLAERGGGPYPVVPQAVPAISVASYDNLVFIAWPEGDYRGINASWQGISQIGGPASPFGENAEIARALAANNWGTVPALLKLGRTVDQARAAIRGLLQARGIPTTPIKPAANARGSKLGWFLATIALGTGISLAMYLGKQYGEVP